MPEVSGMERLRERLRAVRGRGERALGLFVTSGFPNPEATVPILRALDEGGADFLELGMPFSDPLAEGPTIQRASTQALARGASLNQTFRAAEAFRSTSDTPLMLMGYVNPLLKYGLKAFCRDAASSGADGLILPDLPPEEADALVAHAAENGLALAFLIAPNSSDQRVQLVDRVSTGFVYAVSTTGVTGGQIAARSAVSKYLSRAAGLVHNNPLLVGFGIRTPSDVAELTEADGCIVGSAVIDNIIGSWEDPQLTDPQRLDRLRRFASSLKAATTTVSA